MSFEDQSPVNQVTPDNLAAHIASILDGDWDDELQVYWSVTALNERLLITLRDDNGMRRGFHADIKTRQIT